MAARDKLNETVEQRSTYDLPQEFRTSPSLNDERHLWATNAEPATFLPTARLLVTCRSPLPQRLGGTSPEDAARSTTT